MNLFNCIITLRRDDPRYSRFGNGDELIVAVVTSMEAAKAVGRLYPDGVPFKIWPVKTQRRFWV